MAHTFVKSTVLDVPTNLQYRQRVLSGTEVAVVYTVYSPVETFRVARDS